MRALALRRLRARRDEILAALDRLGGTVGPVHAAQAELASDLERIDAEIEALGAAGAAS